MVPKISAEIIDQTQNSIFEVYDQTVHCPVTSIDQDFGGGLPIIVVKLSLLS